MARPRNADNPAARPELAAAASALKEARETLGLSQRVLSERLGVSTPALARYELALRAIPRKVLIRAAQVLSSPTLYGFLRPDPGTRPAGKLAEAARDGRYGRFFSGRAFMAWWGLRTVDLATKYGFGRPEIDEAHDLLVDLVSRALVYTQRYEQPPTDELLMVKCDAFFALICELNEPRRVDGAAA